MAWIWVLFAAGSVLLWAISLGRILSSPAPSCLPPLRGHGRSRNVLLVIAHPDDESMSVCGLIKHCVMSSCSSFKCSGTIIIVISLKRPLFLKRLVSYSLLSRLITFMFASFTFICRFFTPTILFFKSKGHNIHILCMSQGNADGIGNIRKEELYYACDTLKIPRNQVKVFDHPKLQDGFHEKWDHGLLADLTMEHVQLWDIDMIVTFDSYGVSGHPNHQDVHHGVCKFLQEKGQENIEALELESLNILRKYSGPIDILLSSLISSSKQPIYTVVNNCPSRSYRAMAAHKSQWVWYRRLFVMFSSYTYINMLQKI